VSDHSREGEIPSAAGEPLAAQFAVAARNSRQSGEQVAGEAFDDKPQLRSSGAGHLAAAAALIGADVAPSDLLAFTSHNHQEQRICGSALCSYRISVNHAWDHRCCL
jgi:hypothetical protein